jgi:hypothetical protein
VVEVGAGVDDGHDHLGVAPLQVPGRRRVDVGVRRAGDAVHRLAGVVQPPQPAEIGVVGHVVQGAVEAHLAGLGEGYLREVGVLADGLEQAPSLGHRDRVVAGGALPEQHPAAVVGDDPLGPVRAHLRLELDGQLVGKEVAGQPVRVDHAGRALAISGRSSSDRVAEVMSRSG